MNRDLAPPVLGPPWLHTAWIAFLEQSMPSAWLDMGAATTVLSKDMWDRSKEQGAQLQGMADRKLVSVQGMPLHLHGSASIQLELPPEKFWISMIVSDNPTADMILGRDLLCSQRCTIEMKDTDDVLHVQSHRPKLWIRLHMALLAST